MTKVLIHTKLTYALLPMALQVMNVTVMFPYAHSVASTSQREVHNIDSICKDW